MEKEIDAYIANRLQEALWTEALHLIDQDIATAGGAVAGGVVGAKVGGRVGGSTPAPQEVQRCENVSSPAAPDYWDVTYSFRGIEHRVQMSAPPGPTISVNERGEPRA